VDSVTVCLTSSAASAFVDVDQVRSSSLAPCGVVLQAGGAFTSFVTDLVATSGEKTCFDAGIS